MKSPTRALVVVASLLLLAVFVFPLWRYDFGAPQYPEGLSMQIWVNKLGGQFELINQLNHYVGMAPIDAASFPELRFMPWAVAVISATGLVVAALGRFPLLLGWYGLFMTLALAGLADFVLWVYRFGHDLSPEAPITMEPFMPPVIGWKTIANFEIATFPDVGGLAAIAAGVLATVAVAVELWHRRRAART